jgi:hypothetical protein
MYERCVLTSGNTVQYTGRGEGGQFLVGEGRGRGEGFTVVGKNKLSSYKTNREEIDRGSGRLCMIFKLFGFASLRKSPPL